MGRGKYMWKKDWTQNIKNINALNFSKKDDEKEKLNQVVKRHPMSIPQYYLNLIDPHDPKDPIRKLSVPSSEELDMSGDYDTSGEAENTKFSGVQHKYKTTMLVLTTNACFMYCRHCFRKRMVGYSSDEINNRLGKTLSYLQKHKEVNNVLLSGGDSFCLDTSVIGMYLEGLTKIEHLDFIRFGTRSLVVFPQRIYEDKGLLEILEKAGKKKNIMLVTQFNHPNELTPQVKKAVDSLKSVGIGIHNQTVILKEVNDDPKVLAKLLNGLLRYGIYPYYVFQCRPVRAVKNHFQLPLLQVFKITEKAKAMCNGMSKRFKLIMSHPRGKIEILGIDEENMYFRFHQAKSEKDVGKFFKQPIDNKSRWLDKDLKFIG